MSTSVPKWDFQPTSETAYNNEIARGINAVQADFVSSLLFAGHKIEHVVSLSWLNLAQVGVNQYVIPLLISPYTEFLRIWFRVVFAITSVPGGFLTFTSSADAANPSLMVISGNGEYQSEPRISEAAGSGLPQDLRVNVTSAETIINITINTSAGFASRVDAIVFEEISYEEYNRQLV